MDPWYLFYTLDYNPILTSLFYCSNCFQFSPLGTLLFALVSLTYPHPWGLFGLLFWGFFFFCSKTGCSVCMLYIFCLSSRITLFLKEPQFHLLENGIGKQDQGNFLEVQWLVFCTCTAEDIQSLVEELRSQKLHGVARKYIYKSKIRCAFYYWVIIGSRPSQVTEQGNIYMYINLQIFIYKLSIIISRGLLVIIIVIS